MRKTATLLLLGAFGWVLVGCEQQPPPGPAEGLPQNEAPRTEPDIEIGQGEPVEPGEPAAPGIQQEPEPIEPEIDRDQTDPGADLGGPDEPEAQPQN